MHLAGVSAMAFQITELLDRCSRTDGEFECSRRIVGEFIARLPEGTVAPGDTREERAWWFITSAIPALPKNVTELFMAAGKMPKREQSAGAGLEHLPPEELYAARTAQLEGRPWPGRTGNEQIRAPNKIERLKRIVLMANTVITMKSESTLLPDAVIITIQNDPDTNFKPLGESWRAQVNQFRSPEHLAEALAEPDPDLIEAVRAARRDAPDELVIVLWDSFGLECFCCSRLTKKVSK
jgi:hypothetical protein